MFRTVAYMILRSLASLLAVAGLIMPGLLIYDEFTATPARATIVEIGSVCEKRVCLIGRCNWQKVDCAAMKDLSSAGEEVRRKPRAKIEFETPQGLAEAWSNFTKLNIESAKLGNEIDILYRGPAPYYVSAPFSYWQAGLGLLVSLLGSIILVTTGRRRGAGVERRL